VAGHSAHPATEDSTVSTVKGTGVGARQCPHEARSAAARTVYEPVFGEWGRRTEGSRNPSLAGSVLRVFFAPAARRRAGARKNDVPARASEGWARAAGREGAVGWGSEREPRGPAWRRALPGLALRDCLESGVPGPGGITWRRRTHPFTTGRPGRLALQRKTHGQPETKPRGPGSWPLRCESRQALGRRRRRTRQRCKALGEVPGGEFVKIF